MASYAPWIPYTPTVGGMTLGNGTASGWFRRDGTLLVASFIVTAGTTTAGGAGAWTVSLPSGMTSAAGRNQWGAGNLYDSSAGQLWDVRWRTLPSVTTFDAYTGDGAGSAALAGAAPITIGTGDLLEGQLTIEVIP